MSTRPRPPVSVCQAAYDDHAAEYSRSLDPTLAEAAERTVELAGARRGVSLLDLATGTGAIARAAARRGASVVGVDVSAPMLAVARRLSPAIEFRVADAHALPFSEHEFDVVTCGLALSHFAEPLRALGETLRVLRTNGRLVASTWGRGGDTPSSGVVVELLQRHGAAEKGYELDEETWLDSQRGSEFLRRAGFARVSMQTETFEGRFERVEEALQWTLAWPCGSARMARLEAGAQHALIGEARAALTASDLSWKFVFNLFVAEK